MQFTPSILGQLVEALSRRDVRAIVDQHDGDAYDKSFKTWDHLIVLIFAQLSGIRGLRALETAWNANRQHHYHLDCGDLRRSTLSDANKRPPARMFVDILNRLLGLIDRQTRSDGTQMVQLIDSTPIALGKLCDWAKWNGRIRGMKVHVLYDPHADCPRLIDITDANVNDAQVGRTISILKGSTYVFDKGYCHYGWWKAIHLAAAFFVTRPKTNMGLAVVEKRPVLKAMGDGFYVLEDCEVGLTSKGDSKLPIALRRIKIMREGGQKLTLLTNDMRRSPVEIAALYKGRWQIELLFRWIKQHLNIRKFLGNNDNAIRLQILAAMIAYVLLRIPVQANLVKIDILRFTELVAQFIFQRRRLIAIETHPPKNPSRKTASTHNQHTFSFL
jgi:putative transposase